MRRGVRTGFRRLLFSIFSLLIYLAFSLIFLNSAEEPGSDYNIFVFLFGAIVAFGFGALIATVVSRRLGYAVRPRTKRNQS